MICLLWLRHVQETEFNGKIRTSLPSLVHNDAIMIMHLLQLYLFNQVKGTTYIWNFKLNHIVNLISVWHVEFKQTLLDFQNWTRIDVNNA